MVARAHGDAARVEHLRDVVRVHAVELEGDRSPARCDVERPEDPDSRHGPEAVHAHEQAITAYALEGLQSVPGLTVMGPLYAASRGGAISFEIAGVHPHDVAQVLDSRGIAVRAGHHCAKPAHARFGVQSSTRMSSYLYTTPAEIDALVDGLNYTRSYFKLGE